MMYIQGANFNFYEVFSSSFIEQQILSLIVLGCLHATYKLYSSLESTLGISVLFLNMSLSGGEKDSGAVSRPISNGPLN